MRRNTANFIVDAVTLLAIFMMIATGLIIRFVLPSGSGGRHGEAGLALWGLGRRDWGDVHFWVSVGLSVLLVVHVALHWTWVCTTLSRLLNGAAPAQASRLRTDVYGIGFLAALMLLFSGFTWYAKSAVQNTPAVRDSAATPMAQRQGELLKTAHEHGEGYGEIRGSMTLEELEAATGVPVDTLKLELGLAATAVPEDRIGRLVRDRGLSMDRVREVVATHQRTPNI